MGAPALTREQLRAALAARHGAEAQAAFERASAGIAGLGGLGSHVAEHLARLGIGRLVLVDCDVVEPTNLNRQRYDLRHLGMPKAEALAEQLRAINPYAVYESHVERVVPERVAPLFAGCAVVCECFDEPDQKAMLAEAVLSNLPGVPVVAASGMAGSGSANELRTMRPLSNLYLCGDGVSDVAADDFLGSPRVGVCAAHQATMAMRLLLGYREP